jgi:hypothetical protein
MRLGPPMGVVCGDACALIVDIFAAATVRWGLAPAYA